jgi:hypothetical protein
LSSEERLSVIRSTLSPETGWQALRIAFFTVNHRASICINRESEMSLEKRQLREPEAMTPR